LPLSQSDVFLSCPGFVDFGVLLPHLAGMIAEEIAFAAGLLLVLARAKAPSAACPTCGAESGRIHSRYRAPAGRRRDRRPSGGDPPRGPAVLLPRSRLSVQDVR
jgi:hypothetical protein